MESLCCSRIADLSGPKRIKVVLSSLTGRLLEAKKESKLFESCSSFDNVPGRVSSVAVADLSSAKAAIVAKVIQSSMSAMVMM